jgi:hypothetical protein
VTATQLQTWCFGCDQPLCLATVVVGGTDQDDAAWWANYDHDWDCTRFYAYCPEHRDDGKPLEVL